MKTDHKRSTPKALEIAEYEELVAPTDRLPADNLKPVLFGLYGEVGSIMATSKKLHREQEAYSAYRSSAVQEELGDTVWYLATLCRRLGIPLAGVIGEASTDMPRWSEKLSLEHFVKPPWPKLGRS